MRLLVLFLITNYNLLITIFFGLKYSLCCPGWSHHLLPTPRPLWVANAPVDIRTNDLPNKYSVQPRAQSCQWQVFLFANASGSTVAPTHRENKVSRLYNWLCSNPASYVANEHAIRKKLSKARTERHYDDQGKIALSDFENNFKLCK
jgi:hypothetical protein